MKALKIKALGRKFIGYCRVSTEKQENGLVAQRIAIEDFVLGKSGELLEVVTEKESGKKSDRPVLRGAIRSAAHWGATLVIARLDRLSREVSFLFSLRDAGVDFVALDLPELNTLTLAVTAGMAQHERELISQRTKAGLAVARMQGKKFGNPNGFSEMARERQILVRKERALMSEINRDGKEHIAMFLKDGHGLREIARRLTALNVPTPRGGSWSAAQVKRLMKLYRLSKGGSYVP